MKTMKVKPWGEGQGDHVLINEDKFDPSIHEEIGAQKQSGGKQAGSQKGGSKQSGGKQAGNESQNQSE